MAVDDGGGQRQQTTTAREIGRRTTTGKVGSGQQTTMALSIRDGDNNVVFDGGHMVTYDIILNSTICCFCWGPYNFFRGFC
jgi:hypothetical protein